MPRRVPRTWSIAVFVAVVVGVAVVAVGPVVLDFVSPPEAPVSVALGATSVGEGFVGSFSQGSTAGVLERQPRDAFTSPTQVTIVDVAKDGLNDATVTVAYAVGGDRHNETVAVTRESVWAPWQIAAAPPVLEVETAWSTTLTVSGVAAESGRIAVTPGAYRVQVNHELFTSDAKTVMVGLEGGYAKLEPRLRSGALESVTKLVNKRLDQCAASKEQLSLQSGCPFFETRLRVPAPTSASWTVTEYPRITVTVDDDELRVDTTEKGQAVLRWEYASRDATTYTCRFNVDGAIDLNESEMVWTGSPTRNLQGCTKE